MIPQGLIAFGGWFSIYCDVQGMSFIMRLNLSRTLKLALAEIGVTLACSSIRWEVPYLTIYKYYMLRSVTCVIPVVSMPPQRTRNAFDDSRSEASSTRDRQPIYTGVSISKGRRNGSSTLAGSNLKDVTNAQTTSSANQGDAAVSVVLWRMASGQVIILIATPPDQLAISRYLCAPCLSLRPSSRHSTSLYIAIQPKNAYPARNWSAFSYNGTASCTSTYWQRRFGVSS